MKTFYMVMALTLYGVMFWFIIGAMIAGVKSAMAKEGFSKRAFIIGFVALTLWLCVWAFNSSGAMVKCGKHHSEITCRAAIR